MPSINIHTLARRYAHAHTYASTHTHLQQNTHTHTHAHTHTHTHSTHTHYTHTHTHTLHTHTNTPHTLHTHSLAQIRVARAPTGSDIIKSDGVYAAYVLAGDLMGNGRYNIKIKARGAGNATQVVIGGTGRSSGALDATASG